MGVQNVDWTFAPPAGMVLDTVPMDDMEMKNPFIRYEREDDCYYMVGDGGYMWVSNNLCSWVGPYDVLDQDTASWIGASPVITSPDQVFFAAENILYASPTRRPKSSEKRIICTTPLPFCSPW